MSFQVGHFNSNDWSDISTKKEARKRKVKRRGGRKEEKK